MSLTKLKGKRPDGQFERFEGEFRNVEVREINKVIDQFNENAYTPPSKVLVANVRQSGTNAPTQAVIFNTLGDEGVWTRNLAAGTYALTFPTGTIPDPRKVVINAPLDITNNYSISRQWYGVYVDVDTIYLETAYINNNTNVKTPSDGVLYAPGWTMKIEVFE